MAQRIPWDMSEAVIMLDALIAAREGRIARKDAIESVSFELRTRAKKSCVDLDDIFRNVNGITLQMSTMEYILTDGQKGLKKSSMPKLFQDAVAIYRNDRATFEKMLSEAKDMPDTKSIQDQYFSWLASQVSPAQLTELYVIYADIEGFCLKRGIIKKKLFGLTSLADIHKVADTVESNKIFRFTFKKNLNKMSFAMRLYYRFMKEHPEFLVQAVPIKPALEPIEQAEKVQEPAVKNVDNTINFASIDSLAFTQPTEFSYFGELRAKVSSWTQLYMRVISCLLNDYPDTLLAYINRNISGQGRYDFADQTGVRSMVAPKKVQDNFYLETNIGVADIIGKIRKLLDLCNVDYGSLEVYYQKQC